MGTLVRFVILIIKTTKVFTDFKYSLQEKVFFEPQRHRDTERHGGTSVKLRASVVQIPGIVILSNQ
jgi:hypothetical protein